MTNLEQVMPITSTIGELASSESCWFAVQTLPRHEKKVSAELEAKQIQSFLPATSEVRQWSDRKRVIESPLFPGYVFVRIAAESSTRIAVLRTNGVVGFVGIRGVGTPIPEPEITAIQAVLTQQIPFRAFPFLNIGERVRIRGGALDGIEGILDAVKDDQSLVISVELIQRSLAVRISGYHVEPVHRQDFSSRALQPAGRAS
jgi:transcription antitermination factor NusG